MRIDQSEIIVFERSAGSGPAYFLACSYRPRALCVMSDNSLIELNSADKADRFGAPGDDF